jgi:acyl carrier protein
MSDDIDRPANGIVLAATSTENSRRPTSDEVCEVIANSLGLSSVSIDRELSLIDMGIDSLTAVRLADAIQRKFGIAFGVVDVLDAANCIEVARVCQERRDEKDCHCPELPQPRRGMATTAVPASTSQQDLWTLTRLAQALGSAYHIHFRVRIVGILNRDAIIAAIERIVERHEGLRTHFVEDDDVLYQKVALGRQFSIREVEASNSELDDIHLRSKLNADVKAPFDLTTGPLIRGLLMRLSHHEHVLQVTMHHIVSDGWSVGVFLRELKALYRAFSLGRPDPLPPLSIQYADYSVWQREHLQGQRLQNQSDYWKQTLKGAPALLELPLDYPRPAAQSYEGASVAIELDERLTAGLKKLSQQHNTTLFSTMLAGWAALLSRLSGQDEVVIGMPVANRNRAELEPLIGFFVNTLALRVDVSSGTGTADLLMQVRQRVLAAQMNQDLPFAQVVDAVNPVRAFSHSPIFQVMLAWQNFPDNHGLELHGLNIVPIRVANVGAQTDQFLSLREVNGRIRGALTYATALFNKSSIQRYLSCWKVLLQSMVEDQVTPVQQLQWLPEEQRRRLLVEWNATQAPYPQDKCIHELFEAQVEKTPAATAVV